MLRRPSLPVLAACAGQTIWGFSYLFIRVALRYAQPDVMLAMRFVLAFLLINIPLLTGRQKISLKGKPLKPLVLFAITEPLYFLAESYAVLYTNSTYTGVMLAVSPIGSIALAALLLREFPSKRQLLLCLLPITGVILITLSGSSLGIVTPKGAFFLAATCLVSASMRTLNRLSSQSYTSFERTYFIMLSGAAVFFVIALVRFRDQPQAFTEPLSHPLFLLAIIVLSVFCSVAANLLVNYAAGNMPVATFSSFGTITTVCSTFSGVLFLHEPLTLASLAGAILIIVGIRQVLKS